MEIGSTRNNDRTSNKYLFAPWTVDSESRPNPPKATHLKHSTLPLAKHTAFDLFAVIDKRVLERECFVLCLQQQCPSVKVVGFESMAEWRNSVGSSDTRQIILKNIGSKELTDESVKASVKMLVAEAMSVPVVILGEADDVDSVIAALECGAVGYIPPCIHFSNIVEAASLAVAGGIFLSRNSLFALRNIDSSLAAGEDDILQQFTSRQLAVAQILRRGAANKTIAYELALRESTIKVHVRQIFKKLKATNRTQAAFQLNQMSGWPEDARGHGA